MSYASISSHRALAVITAISAVAALALWAGIVIAQWNRLSALGALCGHGGLLRHCSACYPAVALTGLAIAGGLMLAFRGKATRLAPA